MSVVVVSYLSFIKLDKEVYYLGILDEFLEIVHFLKTIQ